MNTKIHGITSLSLVMLTLIIATVVMFLTSWLLGVVYLLVAALAMFIIIYGFCAKCPCRTHCGHVIPGKLAVALTKRQSGPYTTIEVVGLVLGLVLLVGLPQPWLWTYRGWFITFWVLNAIALIQIRSFVCRVCDNIYCPARLR